MKVLLIDDEISINGFINKGLEENGFEVTQAFDGEMGLRLARGGSFDVIILDLIMPGINGLEVCRKLREEHQIQTPILMLTALNTTEDVVEGLNVGADDYLGKPFKFQELLARVRALGRRRGLVDKPLNLLRVADLTIDLDQKIVTRADQELQLTLKEFLLLECLVRNKNRVLSRLDLLEKVWGIHFDTGTNVVDVYMNYLRNKIDKPFDQKLIQTVVGMGYVIRD
ncbi:MAG: response regulator [Bacteroidetes bacterium]|nr:response regulator [Bacteroidota bacterium]